MPKPKEPQGFEVSGTPYRQHEHPEALLAQAAKDYVTPDASRNFKLRMSGDLVTISCHCYERGLGERRRCELQLEAMAKLTDEYLKSLKKRYRELGGDALKMTEVKDRRGYNLEKVSLNDRWMIVYHRVYRFSDLVSSPEED